MFVYLSNIKEPAGTYANVPAIKYTPSSILIDEPKPVGVDIEDPEPPPTLPYLTVVASELNSSPAVKVVVVLLVPEFVYLTYKVAGSEPLAAIASITVAVTPVVAPVIFVPTNSDR